MKENGIHITKGCSRVLGLIHFWNTTKTTRFIYENAFWWFWEPLSTHFIIWPSLCLTEYWRLFALEEKVYILKTLFLTGKKVKIEDKEINQNR